MCVKLPLGDLNSGPCPLHPTNTYTYGVTTTPRVRGGVCLEFLSFMFHVCYRVVGFLKN